MGSRFPAFCLAVGILLCSVLSSPLPATAQDKDAAELEARIAKLIVDLDADEFRTRVDAEKALLEIGAPARAALAVAAKDPAPERSLRAARLLKELRKAGFGLKHLATVKQDLLQGAVDVSLSPDGKFLYASGWKSNALCAFARNPDTGALTHLSSLVDGERLSGAVSLRLSPDGKLAATASFRSKSVALLSRDAENGDLKIAAVRVSDPAGGLDLRFPVDAVFSPDSKFLYAIDDGLGAVIAFDLDRQQLKLVEVEAGKDKCLAGARGMAVSPDGKSIYVTSHRAGTLTVLDRDPDSGRLELRQVLTDEQDEIRGLAGAFSVIPSGDGKFVYVTSGRFAGDKAVSAFRVGEDRKLSLLQEMINTKGDLGEFSGGNQMTISPDGRHLYVSSTVSCSLICFDRDADSGKLTFVGSMRSEATGAGAANGATGIECSRDGKYLYLAVEDAGGISAFERPAPAP
jgi:6-phosphogluconolactonase (cycloisomerase 2 family)